MNALSKFVLMSAAAVGLAGCKMPFGHAAAPTGQVAATVKGQEITVREVGVEMGDFRSSDPRLHRLAQAAAIDTIVRRRILANDAIAQGLDKSPDYAILKQRAVDNLLDELLEKKLAQQVPEPTQEEANAFVTEHPDMFVQRKLYLVDQLRMSRPADPAMLKPLEPLKSMLEVEAALARMNISYEKGAGMIDALTLDPRLEDQITKLPPGEIFIVPRGGQLQVNQIRQTKVIPFTGPQATQFALAYLKRSRVQEAVQKQLSTLVGKGLADVRFNKEYIPQKGRATPTGPPDKTE